MRQEKTYGLVLIASSRVLLAMGVTHPGRLPATRDALEHVGLIAAIAHSLAILGVWLALVGVGATFGGPAYISAHVVLLLALALVQSAWMVWAGVMMIRKSGESIETR